MNREAFSCCTMTKTEAVEFLRNNSPLPQDNELSEELIEKFDEVRKFFLTNPDPDSIPLLLNAFGDGSGFGVYQLVEDVITQFSSELVVPHLDQALSSKHKGVRFWATQIVPSFPSKELIPTLLRNLRDNYSEIRGATAEALAYLKEPSVLSELEELRKIEEDPSVVNDINQTIQVLRNSK